MTRLIDRLVARTPERSNLPDPDYIASLTANQSIGYGSQNKPTERITQSFQAYSIYGFSSNAPVFACAMSRLRMLAQAEFKFQDLTTGRLFGSPELSVLETPWANGTTSDLIANMEQHNSIAGNAFVRRQDDTLVLMRPDWVDIVSIVVDDGLDMSGRQRKHHEVVGYLYSDGGIGIADPVFYDVSEVAHWAPIPDPLSRWRGMSWLTPVLREINADVAMTQFRQSFFDNGGTPSLVLKYGQKLQPQTFESIKQRWQARYSGPRGAGATVVLDEGADLSVVGSTLESMKFGEIQAAGEARIASASGVPAIVAGLQAGLDASSWNFYGAALKGFANTTCADLWMSLAASVAKLIAVPDGARLWYDTTKIPALTEDAQDRANAMQTLSATASTLLTAGYESASIINYLASGDLGQLRHTGLVSVQLYKAAAKEESSLNIQKIPIDKAPAFSPPTLPTA